MAINGSPGITVTEKDLSTFVGASSVTTGAFVGDFEWGPAYDSDNNRIGTLTSEAKLIQFFGYPVDRNYKDWFTARNYLNYSSSLKLVRVVGTDSHNACDVEDANLVINNESVYEFKLTEINESGAKILARYPGEYGNKIRVCILNKKGYDEQSAALEEPDSETVENPITPYITTVMRDDDIAVGVWVNGAIKEYGVYSISDGSTDITGYENYVFKYFQNNSNWIYLIKKNFNLDEAINLDVTLKGGTSEELTKSNYMRGWDLIKGAEDDTIQLLMQGGGDVEIGQYIIDIAESRKDCVACVSPMLSECVNVLDPTTSITTGSGSTYSSSSYAFMDGNYKYQYDQYNDVYRWVPLNGDIAGIMAMTDEDEDPWMSPGGKNIKDCVKLAFYPTKSERDILFAYNVNPVTNFKEEGNVLWGDWTRVTNTSFNFIGVRRCFLYMEKNIKSYAKKIMWKQNDEITETTFVQTVEPFLTLVKGGRGISEFKIYTGDSVRTSEEKDRGIFKAKIAVKPIRSIRYVVLEFVSIRSDMSLEEVIE